MSQITNFSAGARIMVSIILKKQEGLSGLVFAALLLLFFALRCHHALSLRVLAIL